nr:hypothetical protein [Tanacetum cinerariifolium]
MDTTKAQQIALDDAVVAPMNHHKIVKCNHQLSYDLKSNELTIQVKSTCKSYRPLSLHHNSLHFKMNGKSHTLNVENFKDMLQIYPRLLDKKFEDPPFEEEILSFIRDLSHTGEIKSISRRNKMFWHTARDDAMFNMIRVISRHQDTQIYSVIRPDVLTTQEMLDSKAYKEYYAVAYGAVPPKAKTMYKKKTDEPVTSPKSKTASASKGTRLKSKAKVTKPNVKNHPTKKTKAKGLVVLSEVALSEAKQIKPATKRNKKDSYISHASGSDEGTGTIPRVPDVPPYEYESYKESWVDSEDEDDNDDDGESDDHDDDKEDVDEGVLTPKNELTDEEKLVGEESMDDEEDDEVIKDLYDDVNVNLGNDDVEMTDANQIEHQSDTNVITMKMEILLEPTSNKLFVDSILQAGNPVNEILLKLNLPDHRSILTDLKGTSKDDRSKGDDGEGLYVIGRSGQRDMEHDKGIITRNLKVLLGMKIRYPVLELMGNAVYEDM